MVARCLQARHDNPHAYPTSPLSTRTPAPHHDQWPDRSRFDPPRSVLGASANSLTKGDRVIVVGRLKARSWETPEGERRSAVEVEADEIGPSLRWATAKPERATKAKPAGQFNDEPPF
jgi:hypothetical protein